MPVSHCCPVAESVSFVTEDATFKGCLKDTSSCRQGQDHFLQDAPWQGLKPNLFRFFTARLKSGPDTKPGGSHTDSSGLG